MVEASAAIAEGAVRLHEELPDNLAFDYETKNPADGGGVSDGRKAKLQLLPRLGTYSRSDSAK